MMTSAMAEAIVQGGERGRLSLTVLYDERCPLCRRLKAWLGEQATLCPVEFIAADSASAHHRFPGLDHERTTRVLTVVTAEGAVYEGERAWLVCGWTLPAWQPVTEHFGAGVRLRLVRVAARVVDGYRHRLIARSEACERCSVAAPAPAATIARSR
jgi:predicted DCC family thiol-disulfide oxidoreductase YuxK